MERLTNKNLRKEMENTVIIEVPLAVSAWVRLADIEDILGDDYDLDRLRVIINQRMSMRDEVAKRFEITKNIPVDRLRELVEADRGGRCVVLPCKVGDVVYVPDRNNMKVLKKEVRQVSFNHHGKWVVFVGCIVVDIGEIGKTVFLTREEAEAALERMEGEEK